MIPPPHHAIGADPHALGGTQVSRGTVRRVLAFARPYRLMLVGFVVTILIGALLNLVPPLLFGRIIDSAIADNDSRELNILAGLIVAAAFLQALLGFVERWFSSVVGEGLIFDLRVKLFDHVQRMPIGFFTRVQTGALISRLNNDVIGAQRAMTGTLGQVVANTVIVITTVIAMAFTEWRLTVLALVLLPVFVLPTRRVGRRLQAISRQGMELNASMNNTMNERLNVSGAMLVKLFGRHDAERDDFADRAGQVRDVGIRSAMLGRAFFIALTLVGAVGTALVYWIGGHLVISGDLEIGQLATMSLLVARIYTPLTSLTNARIDIMTAFVSFDRVFEVLDTDNAIVDRAGAADLRSPRGQLELDGVEFAYRNDITLASLENPAETSDAIVTEVLRGVSAVVEPGTLVALVGHSGAGKTTLANLVPRLYDVTGGAIRIDGHDVRDLTQSSLRRAIGVVSQDPHLFHDTIDANLRYARPNATATEVDDAIRAAQIHDLITSLPNGLETVVGERGYRLSGGEKQRLAIARMLLKDPAIVILDEATSHLDSENEALVQAALAHALEGRTALVIAHRLSTIVAADQILVIDQGRVAERGTHDELLAAGGVYSELYRTLVRGEVAPT
jgi:ATP-binding cassette subfamily B protein